MISYQSSLKENDPHIELFDVVNGQLDHMPALEAILLELLPQYERYIPRMRTVAANHPEYDEGFVQHQWVCKLNGLYAGIIVFKYVISRNCGLGLDFAIRPQFRHYKLGPQNKRLAKLLIDLCLEQLYADARLHGRGKPIGLLVEVETAAGDYDPEGRLLKQYRRYGFLDLPVTYYEPPFIVDPYSETHTHQHLQDKDFYPMQLGVFPLDQPDLSSPTILKDLISAFLIDHYGMMESHWAVQEAFNSIASTPVPKEL